MQSNRKRFTRFKLLLVVLVVAAFVSAMKTDTAFAETQKKSPYLIKINRVYNTVTVYKQDEKGKYTVPVKAMLCSVGTDGKTVTGTYQTKQKYRWKLLMNDVWGQYATRIVGGILFHSVYYYENGNPASLATKEFNKLGESASHGCVRLAVKDAKWIYDNCALGTTVTIYDDKKSPGPLGKPEGIKIASNVRWDPTDPDVNNPYLSKNPTITGVKNCKVAWRESFDLRSGLKAKSSVGTDITSKVSVEGEVDTSIPGKYKITYSVMDSLNKSYTKNITVTVLNNTQAPEISGVHDWIVNSKELINADYLLAGVAARCKNRELDKKLIRVTIDKTADAEYKLTYRASIAGGPETVLTAKLYLDEEAPVITGIKDAVLEEGEVPSKSFVLDGVTVSDNFSPVEKIKIDVIFTQNPDGGYLVTYTATDEAGNTATEQSVISY